MTERCICELEGSLFCNDREKLVFNFESNWRFREENGCKAKQTFVVRYLLLTSQPLIFKEYPL